MAEVLKLMSPSMHRRIDERGRCNEQAASLCHGECHAERHGECHAERPGEADGGLEERHGDADGEDVEHLREHGIQQLVACAARASMASSS